MSSRSTYKSACVRSKLRSFATVARLRGSAVCRVTPAMLTPPLVIRSGTRLPSRDCSLMLTSGLPLECAKLLASPRCPFPLVESAFSPFRTQDLPTKPSLPTR